MEEKTFFFRSSQDGHYQRQILIVIPLIAIFIFTKCFVIAGNPVPIRDYQDINFEGVPFPSLEDSSLYFKEEVINVTFDSSNAHFEAFYTFKNNGSSLEDIGILLPFVDHYGYSEKPKEIQLDENGEKIPFHWMNFSVDYDNEYQISGDLDLIYFDLSFNTNEEKTIHVQYVRKYLVSSKYGCEYRYLIGTARSWNYSIESASFHFWIPKEICTNFSRNFDSIKEIYSKNFYNETQETDDYYINTIYFNNWIPDENFNIISVRWERDFGFTFSGFAVVMGVVTIPILTFIKKRWL